MEPQVEIAVEDRPKSPRWYERIWLIALMLALFPPIGIVFLWLQQSWNIGLRFGLTCVALIYFVFVFVR